MTLSIPSFFKDLKVVELASVLAGPLFGSFLSELGAEVVKIENKNTGGDITRQWLLEGENSEVSAYYQAANYRKKSIFLDFNDKHDLQTLKQLLSTADVVVSNFQKKVAEKYALDYKSLKQSHPNIIMIQLNAYAYDDERPGFDLVMQAETGFISMCGIDGDHLAKLPVALMDIIAAHQMKEAFLLSNIHQLRTGSGCCAHISLYESAISALANQATNYLVAGKVAKPLGTLHPNIAPYGDIFKSADNVPFMLAIGSDQQFKKLGETLNINEVEHDYLCTNQSRLKHRDQLNKILQAKFSMNSMEVIENQMQLANLPYGKINNLAEVFTKKQAENMVLKSYDANGGLVTSISNIAFKFE